MVIRSKITDSLHTGEISFDILWTWICPDINFVETLVLLFFLTIIILIIIIVHLRD